MSSKNEKNSKNGKKIAPVIAGLDVGSSKVTVIIGTVNEDSQIQIVGVGTAPNVRSPGNCCQY